MDLTMRWYNFLWEAPQTIVGCIVLLFLSHKHDWGLYKGRKVVQFRKGSFFSGTSLGYWILLPYDAQGKTTAHEWGHCVQSSRLGPLYLPTVGIPSLRNNLRARYCERTRKNYYRLYPEAEADRLGGVVWRDGCRVMESA